MHDPLKPFAGCSDAASLICAIHALCAEKGIVSRVDIWTLARSGKRQALCFVRTDPAVHDQELAFIPRLTRIGNELLFIVELPSEASQQQTTIRAERQQ
jgi:hypothetical protein